MNELSDLKRRYRILVAAIALIVVLLVLNAFVDAEASGWHGGHNIDLTIQYEDHDHDVDPLSINAGAQDSGVSDSELDKSRAMSAAGDTCVFDYAPGWQGCIGGGWAGSESALNGSVVTRIDNFALRMNYQTDTDFDDYAFGVGGSWHF